MEKMGKLLNQIINSHNLSKKVNEVMDKDLLYSIVRTIETLTENIENKKKLYRTERSKLNIYHHPFLISKYFCLYVFDILQQIGKFIYSHLLFIILSTAMLATAVFVIQTNADTEQLSLVRSTLLWYGYWIVLGILSSIGLGTGLHTFVLFLGPHIAEVTTAAYTCGNLNFKVFGEGSFICSGNPIPSTVTVLSIFSKVKMQAFFWGLGTAIGELPPYFVSRAAAMAGQNNQNISKFESLNENSSLTDKIQFYLFKLLKKLGFFGILLCASIPNPLFDIAGILCGHFLIPFATFFGATFIGKAIIKNTIQSIFIIISFSETVIKYLLSLLTGYPVIYNFVKNAIDEQTEKFRAPSTDDVKEQGSGLISTLWNVLLIIMIAYFVFSIIESLAISEFQKLKENELASIVKQSKESLRIGGPDEKVFTELTNAAYSFINSNIGNFDKTASREDLKSIINIENIKPKEQINPKNKNNNKNKKLKKASNKKKN